MMVVMLPPHEQHGPLPANHGDERQATDDLALVDLMAAGVEQADGAVLDVPADRRPSQMIREDWGRARTTLATVIANAQRTGMHAIVAFACALCPAEIGLAHRALGRGAVATLAPLLFSDAAEIQPETHLFGHAVLARGIQCLYRSRRRAPPASRCRPGHGPPGGHCLVADVVRPLIGLLDLGRGRAAAAVTSLSAAAATAAAGEIFEPGFRGGMLILPKPRSAPACPTWPRTRWVNCTPSGHAPTVHGPPSPPGGCRACSTRTMPMSTSSRRWPLPHRWAPRSSGPVASCAGHLPTAPAARQMCADAAAGHGDLPLARGRPLGVALRAPLGPRGRRPCRRRPCRCRALFRARSPPS